MPSLENWGWWVEDLYVCERGNIHGMKLLSHTCTNNKHTCSHTHTHTANTVYLYTINIPEHSPLALGSLVAHHLQGSGYMYKWCMSCWTNGDCMWSWRGLHPYMYSPRGICRRWSVAVMATTTMDTCSCVALFVVHARGGNNEGWTVSLKCILADKVSLL